jgi:hypothetical protein
VLNTKVSEIDEKFREVFSWDLFFLSGVKEDLLYIVDEVRDLFFLYDAEPFFKS